MLDPDLSAGARLVYQYLDERARASDSCWPSQKTIATALGMGERTVKRHIAALVDAGYIARRKRSAMHGPNEYELLRSTGANRGQQGPKMAPEQGPKMAPDIPLNETRQSETNPPTSQTLSVREFSELEDGFDRHLKHHRTEPRDTVLQMVMDMAQRGLFDWRLFRERHGPWCQAQSRAGWQYCSLSFLAWIRAGMPPAPPIPIAAGRESMKSQVDRMVMEKLAKGRNPLEF